MRLVSSMSSALGPRLSSLSLSAGSVSGVKHGFERGLERGSSSSSLGHSASVGTNTNILAKECSSQTSSSARPFMHLGVHAAPHSAFGAMPQVTAGFEAMGLDMDAANITRSGKSLTGRFNSGYGFEAEGAYCLVRSA